MQKPTYTKLFLATFTLSAFTFGGGYVIVPLMKKKFCDEQAWIDEDEMLNLVAIAQSSPGPIAVNASILAGHRILGFGGALMAILGTVLPPLITLSVISLFYSAFKSNAVVKAVLQGMSVGVAAMVMDVVIGMAGRIFALQKWLPVAVMAGAFVATYFFHVNVAFVILFCGTLGALAAARGRKSGKELL